MSVPWKRIKVPLLFVAAGMMLASAGVSTYLHLANVQKPVVVYSRMLGSAGAFVLGISTWIGASAIRRILAMILMMVAAVSMYLFFRISLLLS